jgi:hypothetical protein
MTTGQIIIGAGCLLLIVGIAAKYDRNLEVSYGPFSLKMTKPEQKLSQSI